MIISLISSILGMAGGLLPDIFKEIRESRAHTRELARLDKQAELQLKLLAGKTDAKLAEIEGNVAVEEMRAFRAQMTSIYEQQALALLARDANRFAAAVDRLVQVPIGGIQRGALASFAFNLGAGALQASTLLRRVNAHDWDDVPFQFSRWVHAGGRRLAGLVRRRAAEADMFMET